MKKLFYSIFLALFLFPIQKLVFADPVGPTDPQPKTSIKLKNPLGTESFSDLITKATNWLIIISVPILTLMVLFGGFNMLTAGGNQAKFDKGKKIIYNAVIGFAVILVASSLVLLLKEFLGVNQPANP
ncbi:MAG: pilin [Candidatus Paceibacterota bacterium]|jgi:predicted small integral membrane protein